jgi:hypothetical protein
MHIYINFLKTVGEIMPKSNTRLVVVIDKDLKDDTRAMAHYNQMNMSDFMCHLIEEHKKTNKKKYSKFLNK